MEKAIKAPRKNRHPTRDWNPAIVISVLKYSPPAEQTKYEVGEAEHALTAEYTKNRRHSEMGKE